MIKTRLSLIYVLLLALHTVIPAMAWGEMDAPVGACPEDTAGPTGYSICQSVKLDSQIAGLEGYLQLLQDKRVVGIIRNVLWGSSEVMWCDGDADMKDFCDSIKKEPLLPAMVRLVNPGGMVIDTRTMHRELASMTAHYLYESKKPTYFLTVDHSVGWGSYAGPNTLLAEVTGGRLEWVKDLDTSDGKESEIVLRRSLRTAWRLVPRRSGVGQDILLVAGRPNPAKSRPAGDLEFERIYTRFHFDGNRWLKFERTEPGDFFDEGDFPTRGEFP